MTTHPADEITDALRRIDPDSELASRLRHPTASLTVTLSPRVARDPDELAVIVSVALRDLVRACDRVHSSLSIKPGILPDLDELRRMVNTAATAYAAASALDALRRA